MVVALVASGCAHPELPNGWRVPAPEEVYSPHFNVGPWRDESPDRYLIARGDFDGDGRDDEARLLVSADGKQMALFVLLASGPRVQLDTAEVGWLEVMAIEALPPGVHRTACGKGYTDCQPGEPEVLQLRDPGIDYFKFGSADSVFYRSQAEKRFLRMWLSD